MAVAGSLTYDTKLDTSGFEQGVNSIKGATQSAGNQIKSIIAALGIDKLISAGMSTIRESVDTAMTRIDTMNQFTRVMTAMTGSTEKAQVALDDINATVKGTAYGLDIAAKSVQKFVTSGMDLDKATNQVKIWADAVAFYGDGTNATFESVTDALAKMTAKGKIEMDQLNRLTDAGIPAVQIYADSVGKSVEEIQGDLSNGNIKTQEFLDGLSKAFTEGTNRFASITDAAKEAGSSWSATFDNMKAAVARGMVNIIESIDEGLKSSGLPEMRDLIADVGKTAESVMKNVGSKIPGILKNIVKFSKENAKTLTTLISGLVSFKAALMIQSTVNSLTKSVKNLFTVISANPWGIAIAGLTAIMTAAYTLANKTDEYKEKLKEEKAAIDEVRKSQEDLNNEASKAVSQGMSELAYYQNLYLQLQNLVDANGKVKEGYEDRVNFIVGQLSSGLGIEINLVDGIIQNYQKLSGTFNDVVAKKKAMITLNAQEEQYTDAIKKQADAYDKLAQYSANVESSQKELYKLQKEYSNMNLDPIKDSDTIVDYEGKINKLKTYINDQKSLYDEQSKVVEEYTTDIAVYEDNLEKFQAGNYSEMTQYRKSYLADLKLDSQSEISSLAEKIESEKEKLEYLKSMKAQYNTDIYNNQIASSEQRLNQLEKQFEQEKSAIELGNGQTLQAWLLGLSNTLTTLTGKQYEFKDAGDGTVRMFIEGVEQEKAIAYDKIEDFGNKLVNKLDKKSKAKKSGQDIVDGVTEGVKDNAKQENARRATSLFANSLLNKFNSTLDINSPSGVFEHWSKFIPDGTALGIKENTKKAVDAIDYMNDEMIKKVNKSVMLETGNINAKIKARSTVDNNNLIQINATFTGEVDMDKNKVGRIVTPVVSKTLKTGGLR